VRARRIVFTTRSLAAVLLIASMFPLSGLAQDVSQRADSLQAGIQALETQTNELKSMMQEMRAEILRSRAETAALRQELRRWPDRALSLLATVEVTRTARRLGGRAPAIAVGVLAGLRLLAIDPIVPAATQIGETMLRSLDAIHLATAASISDQLGALITYDRRMISEAQTLGLPVLSPA